MKSIFCIISIFVLTTHAFALTEEQKIDLLIHKIASSNLMFIRNGSEHPAAKAAAHLRRKYNHLKEKITTAVQFIEKIASKSSFTGRPYYVKFSNGTTMPAEMWLKNELQKLGK